MTKYIDILNELRKEITDGIYRESEKIPKERELCEIYHASKMTVKKAVDILVNEGYLTKKQGSGTYINSLGRMNPLTDAIHVSEPTSYTLAHKGQNVTSKILTFTVIPADKRIATHLRLNEQDFIYQIYRVRYVDGNPSCVEEVYLPINIIIGLNREHLQHSIYEYITAELKLKPKSFHKFIYSRPSNNLEIKELRLSSNEPVTIIEQVAFLDNGTPYEYSIVSHKYNTYKFKTVIVL